MMNPHEVTVPSPADIEILQNPSSKQEQLQVLRKLKNDIIGHGQRKERAVRLGAVEPLVKIIANRNGISEETPEGNETVLQATIILGSLAATGPAYVQPLIAAQAHKYLLVNLASATPPKLVSASLQTLKSLVLSRNQAGEASSDLQNPGFELFTDDSVRSLAAILAQKGRNLASKQQVALASELISCGTYTDAEKAYLTERNVIECLADLLVSYSIDTICKHHAFAFPCLPPPPSSSTTQLVAEALWKIIDGSVYRSQRFILATPVRDLIAHLTADRAEGRYLSAQSTGSYGSHGKLLPFVPCPTPASRPVPFSNSSSNSALTAGFVRSNYQRSNNEGGVALAQGADSDHANAVVAWLIYLTRSSLGQARFSPLLLLAAVNDAVDNVSWDLQGRSAPAQKARLRIRQIAMLAVPLATDLVQKSARAYEGTTDGERKDADRLREQASTVLARLISGYKELQDVAVEAGAIEHLCTILRTSFAKVSFANPMWCAPLKESDTQDGPATCRLGSKGLPPEILHAMRCRQGALLALGAITEDKDTHRLTIMRSGIFKSYIDSLKPFAPGSNSPPSPTDGNITAVIVAACKACLSISRSVAQLRTNLVDAGIALPIFALLTHPSLDVQLLATDVCANLVLDFSPMKEPLVESGAVKVLCEHARSATPRLRLSSLWALKHVMCRAPKDLKISTLEELGPGWLVGAIAGEQGANLPSQNSGGVSLGLSTANAAGEQVDLLNPSSMDVDDPPMASTMQEDGTEGDDDEDGGRTSDERCCKGTPLPSAVQSSTSTFDSFRYLSYVQETEQNPALQAKRDDYEIQEQALDFLRNVINGEDCAAMVEHIFREIGHQKLFDLLTAKLAPITGSHHNDLTAALSVRSPVCHPTGLIRATIHVLTHIANGSPRHRQLLVAQRPLLEAWLPHFNHPDAEVRVQCLWTATSLTWIEDESDRIGARTRTNTLSGMGFAQAVGRLLDDKSTDVRERARSANRNFEGP